MHLYCSRFYFLEYFISCEIIFQQNKESEGQYKQFLIVRPQVTDEQCHPEEGIYNMVNEEEWKIHMTTEGRIVEDYQLRKVRGCLLWSLESLM